MKKNFLILLMGLFMILSAVRTSAQEEGYATPDECAEAFISCLAAGDVDGMVALSGAELIAERASMTDLCAYQGFWDINMGLFFESTDDLTLSLNKYGIQSLMARRLNYTFRTLSNNPITRPNEVIKVREDPDAASKYVEALYDKNLPSILPSITIREFLAPQSVIELFCNEDEVKDQQELYQELMDGMYYTFFHADEITELCVEISVKDQTAYCFLSLMRYDDQWLINPFTSGILSRIAGFDSYSGYIAGV